MVQTAINIIIIVSISVVGRSLFDISSLKFTYVFFWWICHLYATRYTIRKRVVAACAKSDSF